MEDMRWILWKPSSNDIETGLLKEKKTVRNSEGLLLGSGKSDERIQHGLLVCVCTCGVRFDSVWIYVFACRAHGGADLWDKPEPLPSQQWRDWKRVASEPVWLMASVSGDDCRVHESHRQRRKASAPIPYSNHHWYERARVGGHCFHYWSFQPTHDFHAFIFSFQLFCFLSRPCWILKGGSAPAQIFLTQKPRVSLTWYLKWLRFCCTESFYCFTPMLESELVIVGSSLSCGNRCICSRMAGNWHRFSLQLTLFLNSC